jgi:ankyrin repeat protein
MENDIFSQARRGTLKVETLSQEELNKFDDYGMNLLMNAITWRQDKIALELIKKGIDLDKQNKDEQTAIFMAATMQNFDVVQALLAAGADPNIVNNYGNTALWAAMMSSRTDFDLFKIILKKGGNPLLKNTAGASCVSFCKKTQMPILSDILRVYLDNA